MLPGRRFKAYEFYVVPIGVVGEFAMSDFVQKLPYVFGTVKRGVKNCGLPRRPPKNITFCKGIPRKIGQNLFTEIGGLHGNSSRIAQNLQRAEAGRT